jgi:hypothetical protein
VATVSEYAHQLRAVCGWNRRLARDNSLLRIKLRNAEQRVRELELENANLGVEQDATNHLLSVAMDDLLGGGDEGAVA